MQNNIYTSYLQIFTEHNLSDIPIEAGSSFRVVDVKMTPRRPSVLAERVVVASGQIRAAVNIALSLIEPVGFDRGI